MENWEVVQRNKETGEEKTFLHFDWNTSKTTAEMGAELRRMIVPSEKYDVFIRQIDEVLTKWWL